MRALAVAAALFGATAAQAGCPHVEALDLYGSEGRAPDNATCSSYLAESGQTGLSCYWTFAFRSEAATAWFEGTWDEIGTCRSGSAAGADQLVNHPDSYDLREWITDTGVYALSLKDKGALRKTLVFMRYEPALTQ